nr:Leucine carboxyl methyltransferase [uncultured bacterium]
MADEQLLIHDVSDTSYWVAFYRAQESERKDALFQDPFAAKLVGDKGRRISESMPKTSRYTEWSVLSRTVIIDRYIERLIAEGVDAVINLGAGLDARPYRMNLPANLLWIEADYPHILTHKSKVLQNEKPRCRLEQVAVDLAKDNDRQRFLKAAAKDAKKVLILTEGVVPYLTEAQVGTLADELKKEERFQFWILEYFHPKTYRYLQARGLKEKLKNAPFQFYPEDWYGFFRRHGWKERETRYAAEIAIEFKRKMPMPKWVELILPLIPKKAMQESIKMSGHALFERL